MENSRTSTYLIFLMVTFLLISTYITMVVTEPDKINIPSRGCPEDQKRDSRGRCRRVLENLTQ
ncbi:uncharacterized protein LOC120358067 [Solenopsis invicta]|uniref:uncharacterized protein LOC120358067 n=1 Tax=Solenopsis invicta TaxID=13686 RepID=UPI00193E26DD|nr:uncharacterized protein LOC120358067 [Solenopsis invicta]